MVELEIPALRNRIDDIPLFVEFFSRRFAAKYSRDMWWPSEELLGQFSAYPWPGNVRQLGHVIEQAYVLDCEPRLPNKVAERTEATLPYTDLSQLRSAAVRQAMRSTQGHKGRAAKLLGVHANTMTRLLAQIREEQKSEEADQAEGL